MIRPENMSRTPALLALFCLLPGLAFANAGKIIFAQGEVAVIDADDERTLVDTGHELEEGDRIKTGAEARTQIRLSDGALISLRGNSDYQIVAQKTEEGLMEQAGKLFSGWMRTVTGTIGEENPDAVEQETPVATIGIRGTSYQVIHMPEGGLPGVPESEPGTYIYLQQGRIESTAGGENRFMEPGDVVFVPVEGGAPVPTPNKKSLFSGNEGKDAGSDEGDLLETPGADNDGDEDRDNLESTDSLNDGLNQQLNTTTPLPGGGALGSFILQDSYFFMQSPGEDVLVQNPLVRMESTRFMEGTGEVRYVAQVDSGATPVNQGSHSLGTGDSLYWGSWGSGDYSLSTQTQDGTTQEASGPGDWHYIYADNALTSPQDVVDLGITGQFTYDYTGGTGLTSSSGDTLTIDADSSIQVNFDSLGDTQALQVAIGLSHATSGYAHEYSGSGSLSSLYNPPDGTSTEPPLILDRDDAGGDGFIFGQFAGEDFDAIISGLNLNDNDFGDINGTAAFTASQPPETGSSSTLLQAPGARGYYQDSNGVASMYSTSGQLTQNEDANGPYIVNMQSPDSDGLITELQATATTPDSRGSAQLANDERVIWGIWAQGNYDATFDGTPRTPDGDWHYIAGSNMLDYSQATNLSLTGQYQFDYVGGTDLTGSEGGGPISVGGNNTFLAVDFTNNTVDVNIQTDADTYSGNGSFAEFYQNAIGSNLNLAGTNNTGWSGQIRGSFVGSNAEGAIADLRLNEGGTEQFYGTAVFENVGPQ